MSDKNNKQRRIQNARKANMLESFSEIAGGTAKSFKKDLLSPLPGEFAKQLFGQFPNNEKRSVSGDIVVGESLEVSELLSGTYEENKKLKQQLAFERRIKEEEQSRVKKRQEELKIEVYTLVQEIQKLAKNTQNLDEKVKIAAAQAPANPGIYHVIFFQKLIEFVRGFRKKIEQATVWLNAANERANKKNYWSMYKKHGGKFLLSGEHYNQRSAG